MGPAPVLIRFRVQGEIMNKSNVKIAKLPLFMAFFAFIPMVSATNLPRLRMRCSDDSLDPTQALERVEWATRCNLIPAEDRAEILYTRENQLRPRPMYPTFASPDLSNMWPAPVDRNAPCHIPSGYAAVGFCTSSCYTPEQ